MFLRRRLATSKILIVHFALTPGGATRGAIEDARALSRQGFSVGFASDRGPLETELEADRIPFHRLYFLDSGRYGAWVRYLLGLPLSTFILLILVLRHSYAFLYVQHRQSGIPSTLVSWLTGTKYVFISRSELARYNRARWITPLGKHIITVSEQVRRNVIQYFNVPARNVVHIPNATQTDVVRASEASVREFENQWGLSSSAPVAVCVAMLVPIKAHDVLLGAWKLVLDSVPGAVLLLAGDGPCKGALQMLARSVGIDDAVRFMGNVADMSPLYSRADVVVLASRSEGLPRCIMEGFAYGIPAVATAVSGTPELVIHEKTGLLVSPDNAAELAYALIRLFSNPSLRKEIGYQAWELVRSVHSIERREVALATYFKALNHGAEPIKR